MNSTAVNHRTNGRPSRAEQIQIQKKLLPYFERGINATLAATKTGKNIKTVCSYYNKWAKQREELETKDFFERRKEEIQNTMLSFDNQILDGYEFQDDIDSQIYKLRKEKKDIPRYLYHLKLEVMRHVSTLVQKKHLFLNQETGEPHVKGPDHTTDDISEDKIKELVQYIAVEKDGMSMKPFYSADDLKYEIIKITKCDLKHAEKIVDMMKELGLDLCRDGYDYRLIKFAILRGYVKEEKVEQKREEEQRIEQDGNEYYDRMREKYGPDSTKWPDEDS